MNKADSSGQKSKFFSAVFDGFLEKNRLTALAGCNFIENSISTFDESEYGEENKEFIGLINKIIDVCNLRIRQEHQKLEIVHSIIKSGMWNMDFDNKAELLGVCWSKELRRMVGFNDEYDFPNTFDTWASRLHPDDKKNVLEYYFATANAYKENGYKQVDTDQKNFVVYRLLTKNNEYRWYKASWEFSRYYYGKTIKSETYFKSIGTFVDITHEKEHEKLIQEKLKNSENLKNALEYAEKANNARNEFISCMSHDMRTPLNGIMGMTELAKKYINEPEKLKNYLCKITLSSSMLMKLVNEILDINKLNSNDSVIEKQKFCLFNAVNEIVSVMKSEIELHKHELNIDMTAVKNDSVIGDEMKVKKILINILSNAIKYTPDGGKITIKLEEKKSGVNFFIKDNGIGMTKEFMKIIFSPFSRAEDSRISKVNGTGLGMSITYKIVKLLKGKIDIKSSIGKGSVFRVFIPLKICENKENKIEHDKNLNRSKNLNMEDLDLSGKRILLVEDNELNSEIVVELLRFSNLSVETAENGKIAVDMFKNSNSGYYSLIFMDIQMPVMNGYDATKAIRNINNDYALNIPIIAMSANAFSDDIAKAKKSGMDDYISKPIDISELALSLITWIKV